MKKLSAILLIAVMIFSLAACTQGSAPDSGKTAGKPAGKPAIGVTIYKYDDNFMAFVRNAIEAAAGDKAELTVVDSQNSQATQNDQVDSMIAKQVKALAINLVDPQAAGTIIEKAKAASLPVIFFNKEPETSVLASYDKAWFVGTNSAESGVIQGKLILDSWKANPAWDKNGDGKIQYVMLKGEPGHPDAEARTTESIKVLTDAGIGVEELEMQAAFWDASKAKDYMDAWLANHGDHIEFVVANNDGMALGAIQSLQAEGYFTGNKFMPVVGVDAIPDALVAIKEGKLVGTVLNDAKNIGQATFDLSLNAANGKDVLDGTAWKLDETKAVRVPYVGITSENITFAEEAYK